MNETGNEQYISAETEPTGPWGFTYFVRRADAIKIGHSAIPKQRISALQVSFPEALEVTKFAARVANGEFDATKEESDEWMRSPSGQEAARQLSPGMRQVLGMKILN